LCYAKAFADRDGHFDISSVALANWLGLDNSNMNKYDLSELVEYEYIVKLSTPSNTYKWDNNKQNSGYRINVGIHNNGNYVLKDNNIMDLYFQLFC